MNTKHVVIYCCLLAVLLCIPTIAWGQTNPQPPSLPTFTEGQILYSPLDGTSTYLIDSTGTVNHTWTSSYMPGADTCWLGNNTILRTIHVGFGPGGGSGGGVQIVQADSSVTWDFRYNSNGHLTHHDAEILPNGDVLLIAWETKSRSDAIAAGRNPSHVSSQGMEPDHIIEVKKTGPTSGDIVWEWHVWDHLIQDYDATKDNYGVVADHPELVDINYNPSTLTDWMHTNSVDYNAAFDQIIISVHNFGEVWIIDHSTTTEEAASHEGGRYGHGGDLLYRWGNPQVYRAGTSSDKKLFSQHDVHWIEDGLTGAGDILIFNNGADRPGSHYTTIDEITPPVNDQGEYYLDPGYAYGPENITWEYKANPPTSFYCSHIGGADRLPSGNTLICQGESGEFFEVTPTGTMVWHWYSPYPQGQKKEVFKIEYLPPPTVPPTPHTPNLDCSGSLSWTDVKPGATVTGTFTVKNIGDTGSLLNWTVNKTGLTWGNWSFSPASGTNLTPEAGGVTVNVHVVAPTDENQKFTGNLRVENTGNTSDYDTVSISLTTPAAYHRDYHNSLLLRLLDDIFAHANARLLWLLQHFERGYS